jgi:hypothetical protein
MPLRRFGAWMPLLLLLACGLFLAPAAGASKSRQVSAGVAPQWHYVRFLLETRTRKNPEFPNECGFTRFGDEHATCFGFFHAPTTTPPFSDKHSGAASWAARLQGLQLTVQVLDTPWYLAGSLPGPESDRWRITEAEVPWPHVPRSAWPSSRRAAAGPRAGTCSCGSTTGTSASPYPSPEAGQRRRQSTTSSSATTPSKRRTSPSRPSATT